MASAGPFTRAALVKSPRARAPAKAHLAGRQSQLRSCQVTADLRAIIIRLRAAPDWQTSLPAHGQPRGVEVALDARLLQARFAGDIATGVERQVLRDAAASSQQPGQLAIREGSAPRTCAPSEQQRGVECRKRPQAGGHLAFAEIEGRPSIQAPEQLDAPALAVRAVLQRQRGEEVRTAFSGSASAQPAQSMRAMSRAGRRAAAPVPQAAAARSAREGGRRAASRGWPSSGLAPATMAPAQLRRDGSGLRHVPCPARIVVRWRGFWNATASCGGVRHHPRSRGGRPALSRPLPDVRAAATRRARYLGA